MDPKIAATVTKRAGRYLFDPGRSILILSIYRAKFRQVYRDLYTWFSIVGKPRGFAGIWRPLSGKKTDRPLCQRGLCLLFWIVEQTLVCLKRYLRLLRSLETFLGSIINSPKQARPIQSHMQKHQPEICPFANLSGGP